MPDAVAVLPPGYRLLDANGNPVAGGSLEFFAAGTTNARTVYSDSGLTTALGTVVYLDSGGHPVSTQGGTNKVVIYTGTTAYKVIAKDSDGATVWTLDNILGALDTSAFDAEFAKLEIPATVKSASYTATVADLGKAIDCDTTSGNITVVLPSAVTAGDGATITVKKTAAANTVTVSPVSGQTIDGAGSKSLTSVNDSISLRSNGANWREFAFARPSLSSGAITSDVLDARVVGGLAVVGDVKLVPYATVPDGWLECNGQAISRTTYATLFGKIGTTHGQGDGTTTFNVPDYRGRFLRVWDHGAGRDPDAASRTAMNTGGSTGDLVGSVQGEQFKSHNHTISGGTKAGTTTSNLGSGGVTAVSSPADIVLAAAGGNETRPINAYLMAIILADPAAAGGAADFVHTIHSVSGIPSPSVGIDGDYAIDYTNWNIYGPKASGAWGSATSIVGPAGVAGPAGPNVGLDYQWNTSTSGDPGSGKLLVNNATPSSATVLHISETNRLSASQAAYIATWDDSTDTSVKGTLRIVDISAPGTNFLEYQITGSMTDAGGYDTFPVAYVGGAGTLTNNMQVSVAFFRTGNKGADGAGIGDVTAASSFGTDNVLVRADGTGKGVQATGITVSDTDVMAGAKITATGGTTARTLEARFGELLNVKDFGATGDGSTNDATAVQAAIDAAAGRPIYFPAGTYRIDTALVYDTTGDGIVAGLKMIGEGRNKTYIDNRTGGILIKATSGNSAADYQENVILSQFTITNTTNSTTTTGIQFTGVRGGKIENVGIVNQKNYGIHLLSTANDGSDNIHIDISGCDISDCTNSGIFCDGNTLGVNAVINIRQCRIIENGFGITFLTVQNGTIENCAIAYNTGGGVIVNDGSAYSKNCIIRNNEFDSNTGVQLDIAGSDNLHVATNYFVANSGYSVTTIISVTSEARNTHISNSQPRIASGLTGITMYSVSASAVATWIIGTSWNLWEASGNTQYSTSGADVIVVDGTDISVDGSPIRVSGKETIAIPAGAMIARTTNGAATGTTELATNDIMLRTFDFDTTTEEGVGFWVPMPKSWNESTVTFQVAWTAASGSGGVAWGLAARAFSNDDPMDTAVGGQQVVTDTLITANDMHLTSESAAITISGTPAVEDWVYFELTREVGNGSDTLGVDAKLLGIRLYFTTNAANDA